MCIRDSRITVPGALYLALVSLIPIVAFIMLNADQNFPCLLYTSRCV